MQVKTKTLTGAKILIETLTSLGVDTIFGYPGGIVLKVYDELFSQSNIRHILGRHEQASVHAAEGYARVTGKPGVVVVTSGPGATNVITGLANAYLDGYPLVVLTGQVSKELIGKDAFQEVDIINIARPCTKKTYQVTDIKNLESTLIDAFKTALSGKKGPVLVDLAKNIFTEEFEFQGLKLIPEKRELTGMISEIEAALQKAQRPVIVAGGGVVHSKASTELNIFASQNSIPIVTTMMGLGTFSPENPLNFGMVGIFGEYSANQILRESDLILSLGARFNDRISCCFKSGELDNKIIQIDINGDELSRNIKARLNIHSDIKDVLVALQNFKKDFSNWVKKAQILKTQNKKPKKVSENLHSFEVIDAIYKFTGDKNITIATEVGQHQLWCAKGYKFSHAGQFITSGGSGTMGFGLPAAIGASIAQNNSPVICITGDGSFQMNIHELATIIDYNLPIKIMVLNNGYLGMVRQLQQNQCEGRYSETKISNPDFLKLAQSYGIEGVRVHSSDKIQDALEKCFSTNLPYLIDFCIEPFEVV